MKLSTSLLFRLVSRFKNYMILRKIEKFLKWGIWFKSRNIKPRISIWWRETFLVWGKSSQGSVDRLALVPNCKFHPYSRFEAVSGQLSDQVRPRIPGKAWHWYGFDFGDGQFYKEPGTIYRNNIDQGEFSHSH